jgi:exopolysaccharide biosynthesis polyprenyl glycosylphosphotransferase
MSRQTRLLPRILVDAFACIISLLFARQVLPYLEHLAQTDYKSPGLAVVGPVAAGAFPFLVIMLILADLYDMPRHWSPLQALRSFMVIGVVCGLTYGVLSVFIPKVFAPPFKAMSVGGTTSLAVLWLLRVGWPEFYSRPWKKRRMLLIGAHTFAIRALQRFSRENAEEMEVIGVIDDFKGGVYFENLEVQYFGGRQTLPKVLQTHQPDTIVVLNDQSEYASTIISHLDSFSCIREVYVRAQIPLFVAQDIDILFVQEVPLLKLFSRGDGETWPMYPLRNVFDKLVAILLMIVAAPIFIFVPLLIKLDSKGPIFYRQKRLGLHNKPFWVFKFRSMVVDAEKKSGAVLAQKNDPRVTRIGRFMRATRIDEVPQLLNVLRGEMSMIGPRPERPEFQNSYLEAIPWYPLRALCKPGVTGLAQVNGDYHTSTQRKLLYDVTYLANMSPLLDLRILVATVVTVLTKSGH